MHLRSACLRFGAPLAIASLVACQAPPAPPVPPIRPSATQAVLAPPAAATPTSVPSSEPVTLAPIKDQLILVDQVGYLPGHAKVGLVADATATSFQLVDVG